MLPRRLLTLALALLAGCASPPTAPASRYPAVELAPNQHPTPK